MSEEYQDDGKNGGVVRLEVDGEWTRVTWRNRKDTYETVVAVPTGLLIRFVTREFGMIDPENPPEKL